MYRTRERERVANPIIEGLAVLLRLFTSPITRDKVKESPITIFGDISIPTTYVDSVATLYNQTRLYRIDYRNLYIHAPQVLVEKVVEYLPASAGAASVGLTYENILRSHIELAKLANHSFVKTADLILWLCIGWGGIQRTSLCTNWACLLFNLCAKFRSNITSDERNRIARGGIALAIGSTIAFFQYMHKSPYGVTNYLRIMYEGYNDIRDWCNQHFSYQIPDVLKMESPRKEFARMTDDEKTTVGQMLNMVYTFRVGDAYLETCKNVSSWTDTTMDDLIDRCTIPLPEKEEIEKMYRLYTGDKIYYL